jgi:hypothetical protein
MEALQMRFQEGPVMEEVGAAPSRFQSPSTVMLKFVQRASDKVPSQIARAPETQTEAVLQCTAGKLYFDGDLDT